MFVLVNALALAPAPPIVGCNGTPNIGFFNASNNNINSGQSTTLNWGLVSNASSADIDQGIGGIVTPGSRTVSPNSTTTYTLTARCGFATQTAQVTITVNGTACSGVPASSSLPSRRHRSPLVSRLP